jgi:hypothetical protein
MAKTKKATMVRRGVEYKIERNADGTFGRFIPVKNTASVKQAGKKATSKKVSAKTSSKQTSKRATSRTTSKRARI